MSEHYKETRPWGNFEILSEFEVKDEKGQDVTVKKITVNPKSRLSYQSHKFRDEHWTIVQGQGSVILNDVEKSVKAGDTVEILKTTKHRVVNNDENQVLVFIEVSTGHFDENDNTRYEDDYGRV